MHLALRGLRHRLGPRGRRGEGVQGPAPLVDRGGLPVRHEAHGDVHELRDGVGRGLRHVPQAGDEHVGLRGQPDVVHGGVVRGGLPAAAGHAAADLVLVEDVVVRLGLEVDGLVLVVEGEGLGLPGLGGWDGGREDAAGCDGEEEQLP